MKRTITAGILFTVVASVTIATLLGYLANFPAPPVEPTAGPPTSSLQPAFNRPPTALAGVRPFLGRWPTRFRGTNSDRRPLLGPLHEPVGADERFSSPYPGPENWPALLAREFSDSTGPAMPREPIAEDPDRIQLSTLDDANQQDANPDGVSQAELWLAEQALSDALASEPETLLPTTNLPQGLDPAVLDLINNLQFYPAEQPLLSNQPEVFTSATPEPAMAQQDAALNQMQIQQNGELNSLALLLLGENNRLTISQNGVANSIGGIAGESAFEMSGINSAVTFQQMGNFNQIYGMQETTNSIIRVRQVGQGNVATIMQRN